MEPGSPSHSLLRQKRTARKPSQYTATHDLSGFSFNTQRIESFFFWGGGGGGNATCPYKISGPPPPGLGRSVTDFWGWGAHRAQLRYPDGVSDGMYKRGVPGGGLKPNFYKLPRPWSPSGTSPARENSHGRTGNRTRDLMVSSQKFWPPGHKAGRIEDCLR
jgi:hypothetical protein